MRRRWPVVVVLLLIIGGGAHAQQFRAPLEQAVRLAPGTHPLGQVLTELSRQSGLPFSYSSSLVPLAHRAYFGPAPPRPLRMVLREALAPEHLSFGLLNGQLVLWPERLATPAGVTAINGRSAADGQPTDNAALATSSATTLKRRAKPATSSQSSLLPAAQPGAVLDKGMAASAKRATDRQAATLAPSESAPVPMQSMPRTAATRSPVSRRRVASGGRRAGMAQPEGTSAAGLAAATRQRLVPDFLPPLAVQVKPVGSTLPPPGTLRSPALPVAGRRSTLDPASAAAVSFPRTSWLSRGYLHGEAWTSESLPLNAVVKVGIQRIYLLGGVAFGPLGRHPDWAGGVGLGTAGRPRGRFTPSLDLVHWWLSTGPEPDNVSHQRLTQLRPTLAWQLKAGGRWQLVGGPTLNLATARSPESGPAGRRGRWDFGRDQWLWLNDEDNRTPVRLWPGVQLGLRF